MVVLDEVKVLAKIAMNSSNGQILGIAMQDDECGYVKDLYADLNSTSKEPVAAEYFLQFLWRDLSSDFDVIGPHYGVTESMDANFTHACTIDAIHAFQVFNFKVSFLTITV